MPRGRGGGQVVPRPVGTLAGGSAPWAGLSPSERRLRLGAVRSAFASAGPAVPVRRESPPGTHRPAAVLAPLYEDPGGELQVVLTRRTWDLRSHKGEVSFPGGRQDERDPDLLTAALREAQEEIGLDSASVELIGELDHLATLTSRSFIVPYVGALVAPPRLRANPAEVEEVLHVPIAELADPAVYREERWPIPGGRARRVIFFELVGDTVWGATGTMLRELLGVATGTLRRGEREDHL